MVVSEVAKSTLASGLKTFKKFHSVLDHGLNLHRNIPLSLFKSIYDLWASGHINYAEQALWGFFSVGFSV